MSNELALLVVLSGVIAGAFVARVNNEPAWKGAVVMLSAVALAGVAYFAFPTSHTWLMLIVQMLGAGLAGGALKLRANLIVGIFVISGMAQIAAAFLSGLLGLS